MSFNNPGAYSKNGDNPDGTGCIDYLYFEAFSKVLSCNQTITPANQMNSNYEDAVTNENLTYTGS